MAEPFPIKEAVAVPSEHLRLGAWNIEHLGLRTPAQKASDLASYIIASHVDVLALEEIHDDDQKKMEDPGAEPWKNAVLEAALPILTQATGDVWKYELTPPSEANKRVQLTGVLWRASRATLTRRIPLEVTGGSHNNNAELTYWTRRPEAFVFAAGKPSDKHSDFVFIPLHMKSNSDSPAIGSAMRKIEAQQLLAALPALKAKLGNEKDFVLLGDSNINAPEQEVQEVWADFDDLNEDDRGTYHKGNYPPSPFDRIFTPKGQPEFTEAAQFMHGPYPIAGKTNKDWLKDHLKYRSDHLLVWCDIAISSDDD